MLLFLLAGEQGEQCSSAGFCILPVAPPRELLKVNDWAAKGFFELSSQTMFETAPKDT